MSRFKKAERQKQKLKLAIYGPSGSGKTWSALSLAKAMGCNSVAVIDSEKSATLYSDRFKFDVCDLEDINSKDFINEIKMALKEAIASDYDCIIIDSFTHLWKACLDYLNKLETGVGTKQGFYGWKVITPLLEEIIKIILQADKHIIVTMRAKTAHEAVKVVKDGKETLEIATKGIEAVMRDGIEYEFTTIFRLDMDHKFTTIKDRTGLFDSAIEIPEPFNEEVGQKLIKWLNTGAENERKIQAVEEVVVTEKVVSEPAKKPVPSGSGESGTKPTIRPETKARLDALLILITEVNDANSYGLACNEWALLRPLLPDHVINQVQPHMDKLDITYRTKIEAPF